MPPISPFAQSDSAIGVVGEWVMWLVDVLGVPGLWFLVFAENFIPAVPSVIVLPLVGLAVQQGKMGLGWAIFGSTVIATAGAFTMYWIGRLLGHRRTVRIFSKIPLVDASDIERTIAWFERHGEKVIFFGRMMPIFRVFISIPAGINRMSQWRFGVLSFIGTGIWNVLFIGAGYLLGENWTLVLEYAHILQAIIIALIVAGIAWFICTKVRHRRAGSAANEPRPAVDD